MRSRELPHPTLGRLSSNTLPLKGVYLGKASQEGENAWETVGTAMDLKMCENGLSPYNRFKGGAPNPKGGVPGE